MVKSRTFTIQKNKTIWFDWDPDVQNCKECSLYIKKLVFCRQMSLINMDHSDINSRFTKCQSEDCSLENFESLLLDYTKKHNPNGLLPNYWIHSYVKTWKLHFSTLDIREIWIWFCSAQFWLCSLCNHGTYINDVKRIFNHWRVKKHFDIKWFCEEKSARWKIILKHFDSLLSELSLGYHLYLLR